MSYEEEDTCAGGLLHAFRVCVDEEEDTCHMRRRMSYEEEDTCAGGLLHAFRACVDECARTCSCVRAGATRQQHLRYTCIKRCLQTHARSQQSRDIAHGQSHVCSHEQVLEVKYLLHTSTHVI